jgi:hypothetical protein
MIGDESNVKGEHRTMKMILHCLQVAMLAVMFVASPALPSVWYAAAERAELRLPAATELVKELASTIS